MSIAKHVHFDFAGLASAVEGERHARGLSWAALLLATRPAGGPVRHRVSATTLARIGQQRVMEADGVLVILAALGRTFEEFTKRSGPHTTAAYAPVTPVDRAGVLRFDAPAVHDALALRKAARGLTWRAVAEEIGLARPANLTRLARGGRLTVPGIVHIAEWLGRAPETLTAPADW